MKSNYCNLFTKSFLRTAFWEKSMKMKNDDPQECLKHLMTVCYCKIVIFMVWDVKIMKTKLKKINEMPRMCSLCMIKKKKNNS